MDHLNYFPCSEITNFSFPNLKINWHLMDAAAGSYRKLTYGRYSSFLNLKEISGITNEEKLFGLITGNLSQTSTGSRTGKPVINGHSQSSFRQSLRQDHIKPLLVHFMERCIQSAGSDLEAAFFT